MNKKMLGATIYDAVFSRLRVYSLIMKVSNCIGLRGYRRTVLESLGVCDGDCVLEVGVGNGENLKVLKELYGESFDFFGLDLSPGMVSETNGRARKNGWKNVELVVGDAEELSSHYDLDSFDKVICINSLNFYPKREETLEMMVDVLKLGGKLLVSDLYIPKDCSAFGRCVGDLLAKSYSVGGFTLRPPVKAPKGARVIKSGRVPRSGFGLVPFFKIFKKES